MAQPHHTQARKEAQRAHAAIEFPQYPAATYTPRPYTTRTSQPIKHPRNGASRQAGRPDENNDPFANHGQKTLNTVWPGRSRTRSRRIRNGILAAIFVLGIILTIVFTLKKLDKSRQ